MPTPQTHLKATFADMSTAGSKAKKSTPKALKAKVEVADDSDANWVSIGACPYIEDIATCYFWASYPVMYNVDVYQDQNHPGVYRIVNPWKDYPYLDACIKEGGIFDQTENSYITIDATDPNHVVIPVSPLGLGDDDDTTQICSDYAIYEELGLTEEQALATAGVLADNVITFDQENSLCLINTSISKNKVSYYDANIYGKFSLVLPGGETPVVYDIDVNVENGICPDKDGNFSITVTGDSRIPNLYYKIFTSADDLYDADYTTLNTDGTPININEKFALKVPTTSDRKFYVLFAPADITDQVQEDNCGYIQLYNPEGNAAEWELLGTADMTEGLISGLFNNVEPETYEVTVEKSTTESGLLRIVNPYENWSYAKDYLVDHGHNHYIYINASDPDNVMMMDGPIGLELGDFGEVVINSELWDFVEEYGEWVLDYIDVFGYEGGKLADNVITFPYSSYILMRFTNYNSENWYYTNLNRNPEYDDEAYAADPNNYDVSKYIDGDFKLDLTKAFNGVESISVDNSSDSAVFYNLQGVRVANPDNGIFIKVVNGKASKIAK